MKRTRILWAVLLSWALAASGALAQEEEEDDPGVARISYISGDVSLRRGDAGEWVAAAANAPLVVPDGLFTGIDARAEVQFDSANMIRLASRTEVRFSELEYLRYQVQVAQGTVTFARIRDRNADIDINTPNISMRPLEQGDYRITVREDGATEITVRSGEAEVFSPLGIETLRSGRTMVVRGTAANPEFQMMAAIPRDDWDRWNADRDSDLRRRGEAYQYVSQDVYGVEDMDGHGRWVWVPGYDWVWSPTVTVDWAPYRYGRWGWTDWYGWTWISYDPWGWAPYHYGRWFHYGSYGWCWWPGGIGVRNYWRPAHVAFIGWGHGPGLHVGVNVGFGHVGWVPLGPREPFHRWYGRGYYGGYRNNTYIDNSVNIVNNINITNIYRNARVDGGITAVNGEQFGNRRVDNVYQTARIDLRDASLVRGQVPVVPDRASLRISDREVRTGDLPTRTSRETFATRGTSRTADRVPFEQQQRSMERVTRTVMEGESGSRAAASRNRATNAAEPGPAATATRNSTSRAGQAPTTTRAGQTTPEPTTRGWRRFGETGGAEPSADAASSARGSADRGVSRATPSEAAPSRPPASDSGWRRFGESNSPSRSAGNAGPAQSQTPRSSAPSRSSEPSSVRSAPSAPSVTGQSPSRQSPSRPSTPSRSSGTTAAPSRSDPSPRPSVAQPSTPSRPSGGTAAPSRPAPAPRPSVSRPSPSRSSGASAAPTRSAPAPRPSVSRPSTPRPSPTPAPSASRPAGSSAGRSSGNVRSSGGRPNQR